VGPLFPWLQGRDDGPFASTACVKTVAEEKTLCEVRGLSISYRLQHRARVPALDGLNLMVSNHEVIGILGESGSGKSTLAAAIPQLLPAHARREQGMVLFRGRDVCTMSDSELRKIRGHEISLIFQDPALALNPVMTIGSQIAEPMRTHLPLSASERKTRVLDLLSEVGFDRPREIARAYPHQLSGGERQRVAIGQAISCRPALLIADEPTSKLDAPLQAEIVALLRKIRREHELAILLITHDPTILAGFADRIAVMYAGRIIEVGSAPNFFRQPFHPYSETLVKIARETLDNFQSGTHSHIAVINGESPDPASFPTGCRFHPRCPVRMDICDAHDPAPFLVEPTRLVSCFKYGE
jgi:oligopeptide/dipeptide ABC transporter ATP-binding protein